MSDLSHLPPLRDVIARYELRAKKSLGQNFLLDLNLTSKIVRQAGDLSSCHVVEIGPGPGGLTRALLESDVEDVHAIEYDDRAIAALSDLKEAANGRLNIHQADAMGIDVTQIATPPRAIVANLPYNIATPLLIGWLKQIRQDNDAFRSMTLMFQKEVAQRIVAGVGTSAYGRLSIMAQWLCDVSIVMDIPPQAFTPPPKVHSSVVHFAPKMLKGDAPYFDVVEKITEAAFGQRRKMIRSSLKAYSAQIEALGLNPELRAENLSVEDYIALAKAVSA